MPIPLRADFDALRLRAIARGTKDAAQTRRLLALAAVYDGARRTEAAAIGGVTLQIVRDWVMKFNADGPDGLIDRKAPGQPSKLNHTHRAALKPVIESGPIPAVDGVVRWRLVDLCQWIWEEFRIGIAKPTLGQARLATLGTARSTYRLDLYLRRHLPQERQGRRPRPAPLQHRRDEPASGRDRDGGGAGRSRRARPRPGRMAPVRQAHRAAEHHAGPAAGQMPRTQPGRECLAVHPRQLALQPRLPLLR